MQLTHTGFEVRDAIALPRPGTTVRAEAERHDAYSVRVTTDIRSAFAAVAELVDGRSVAILTDETVEALYGPALVRHLRTCDADPLLHAVPPGEGSKSLERACGLWDWLAGSQLARRDVLVNFGGGVIADLGGWVASAYMRGLPYLNLPTTLLAQVDGALGGKVAVNHPSAKNLLGAFHQPIGVVAHVGFLRSTSARHMRAGLAEAIKKAVIASPELWAFIDERADAILDGDAVALERLVSAAAAIKTALIARDPYELDLRRPLNYGHTVGRRRQLRRLRGGAGGHACRGGAQPRAGRRRGVRREHARRVPLVLRHAEPRPRRRPAAGLGRQGRSGVRERRRLHGGAARVRARRAAVALVARAQRPPPAPPPA
jgi:3-dehydroquinate synthase